MSTGTPSDSASQAAAAAAAAAAQDALYRSTVESWTLYSVGVFVTILRTYGRIRAVGIRKLRADDYLVWVGILFYTIQTSLAHTVGHVAHGLANNGMTDEERATLSPSDPEYHAREVGSKVQVAGWATYTLLIGFLKLSVLAFYIRLLEGVGSSYRLRINIGFVLVSAAIVASLCTILFACRPFDKYWQINPDPGTVCQAGISRPIIWVSFAGNIISDIYLIVLPLPMLWGSRLKMYKKIASSIILGAGIFVLVCCVLKSVFVLVDPEDGGEIAAAWGTREAFVAVVTTNLPMLLPLFKTWLTPLFGNVLRQPTKSFRTATGIVTIGGGGMPESLSRSDGRRTPYNVSANRAMYDSEEQMVEGPNKSDDGRAANYPANTIVVSNQFEITQSYRNSQQTDEQPPHNVPDVW